METGKKDRTRSGKLSPVVLQGIPGSKGVCLARAYVFKRRIEVPKTLIDPTRIDQELERLETAVELTRRDILAAQSEAREKHGEKYAAIFESHLLMLSDPQFKPQLVRRLKAEKVNLESIVRETVDSLTAAFSSIEDDYLRERAIDVKDVGDRLLRHLMGLEGPAKEIGEEPFVLLSTEITPSELLDFSKGKLKGICLDSGGATSHVAILAASLGIPSVFGLHDLSHVARTGDQILVDTRKEGIAILHPAEADLGRISEVPTGSSSPASVIQAAHPRTRDGVELVLGANIARVEELHFLPEMGCGRIGLFRSEFLFMESMDLPSESFQESVYRKVVASAQDMVVLRTIDIGSDKPVKYLPFPKETNPSLGFRSIRFSLARPDILLPQLRAMIRAAQEGKCHIIFPMVSTIGEMEEIRKIYEQAVREVRPAQVPPWGIMVEVPSAMFMMDQIAKYTRYISLGTNDLIQFFFGVDRTNERLAHLADHLCIPFLRLLFYCVATAKAEGVKVGICGEMASDPYAFLALVGIGVDEFSIRPAAFPTILELISRISYREVVLFVQEVLSEGEPTDLRQRIRQRFPDVVSALDS